MDFFPLGLARLPYFDRIEESPKLKKRTESLHFPFCPGDSWGLSQSWGSREGKKRHLSDQICNPMLQELRASSASPFLLHLNKLPAPNKCLPNPICLALLCIFSAVSPRESTLQFCFWANVHTTIAFSNLLGLGLALRNSLALGSPSKTCEDKESTASGPQCCTDGYVRLGW